ncbi:hypothetical protein [Hymenobacter weizhouensis]|uniref:hypothetical protein n=1 Tax=Hymenobacter sp. YIM 151500-1 TaxID=2987689 RepID=UPI002226AAC7|nr:hypothetical protein [Hymenobacter sp. YIM 151500-1]UYZ64809.1 hypothetical protein OIS53_08150 [Hymenobacter sp. YIM 151500-1]
MARFTALFLCLLLLLQTFSRELLVLHYQARKVEITRLFCVNQDKPRLHCNGKCHLRKQLKKAATSENGSPDAGLAKVKYEVLPPGPRFEPQPMWRLGSGRASYAPSVQPCYAFSPVHGVFHPPASRV